MSDLAAALARPEGLYPRPEQFLVIEAAARERLRLQREPCETCGGTAIVRDDRERLGLQGQEIRYLPCPACGGSGLGDWPAELVGVVERALTVGNKISEAASMRPEMKERFRERALIVLTALDAYLTGTLKGETP